jgi:hypothetical protein
LTPKARASWREQALAFFRARNEPQRGFALGGTVESHQLATGLKEQGTRVSLEFLLWQLATPAQGTTHDRLDLALAVIVSQQERGAAPALEKLATGESERALAARSALVQVGGERALRFVEGLLTPGAGLNGRTTLLLAGGGDARTLAVLERLSGDESFSAGERAHFRTATGILRRTLSRKN